VKRLPLLFSLITLALGCSRSAEPAHTPGLVPSGTPDGVNVALARERLPPRAFPWATWSKQTFERAKREKKFILLHGAAAWCHWCHVMEETTYRDPEVGRILEERFIAIKVDIDSRPDIEERYGEWGWPATILFSPDAAEVGKFRGYLPPDEMREVLTEIESASLGADDDRRAEEPGASSAHPDALTWVALRVTRDMDYYYDAREGGWGMRQKAPIGENAEMEARRAAHGDMAAQKRLVFSLRKQRALMDPVWGGLYQYSAAQHWREPHFEKLMTFQAPNLEAYSRAYALTKQPDLLKDASAIVRYVDRFMTSPAGTFYTNQDADVGAHDEKARFIDGHIYYTKNEAGRLALGVPWIDKHVYARENGMLLSALVAYGQAGGERGLERARKAASSLLQTHVLPNGEVKRDPEASSPVRFLADSACLGLGLARLAEATGDAQYSAAALRIAERLVADLSDESTGALFAHTKDPDASGVFSKRRHPFAQNVSAARLFSAVHRLTKDDAWQTRARRVLAAIATPAALDQRGRMIGEYLLALDEAGVYPWPVSN
jgi:uncharacterized protein YyaL (SSP411 family)